MQQSDILPGKVFRKRVTSFSYRSQRSSISAITETFFMAACFMTCWRQSISPNEIRSRSDDRGLYHRGSKLSNVSRLARCMVTGPT